MNHSLPVHPRTGLRAVGLVNDRPVWPILGAEGEGELPPESQFSNVVTEERPEPLAPEPVPARSFTEEDVINARRSEKEKLYPEIERLKDEVASFKSAQEQRASEEAAAQAAAEEEAKRKLEEEMDVRTLLQKKEAEWEAKINEERTERERAFALLEREREYVAVQQYRSERIDQERDTILPELIDLVSGDSQDQIEASINGLKERSDRILSSAQQAAQSARRDVTGSRVVGAPPADPLENYSGTQSFTPDQLRNMSMDEYAQYRSSLVGGETGTRGLFG